MNQKLKPLFVLITSLALSTFCQGTAFSSELSSSQSRVEPLYAAQFDDRFVIIDVKSHGCTRPEHFSIQAKGKPGYEFSRIRIVRDKPDLCKAAARIIRLYLELPPALAALKEPYRLENLFHNIEVQ